jgi:6-phosphogluconate dehydrogenase
MQRFKSTRHAQCFCPTTAAFIITSNFAAISFLPSGIAPAGIPPSASGVMSQVSRSPRDFALITSCIYSLSTKLTAPGQSNQKAAFCGKQLSQIASPCASTEGIRSSYDGAAGHFRLSVSTLGAACSLPSSKGTSMQLGMIGLGRMGGNMVERLITAGHDLVVYDNHVDAVQSLVAKGATGTATLSEFVTKLAKPRAIWMMLPAAIVDTILDQVAAHLEAGDIVIDGGNSYYHDDLRRAHALKTKNIHYVDVGVSGGVWGKERGYCHMIGGEDNIVARLDPIFRSLAPGVGSVERTPGAAGTPTQAEHGYLHCGPNGAGHFVKMVHNGIEYGMMAALAEGLNVLKKANVGLEKQEHDAETTPLPNPELYQYTIDVGQVAEVWRRGSVVGSWLLDLTAAALRKSPELAEFRGRVSDSGEGRWTLQAAIDEGVSVPVMSAALYDRFTSRGQADFADKLLSAMRLEFGGHLEKAP